MNTSASLVVRLVVVPLATIAALVGVFSLSGGFYTRLGALLAGFVVFVDLATFARGWLQNVLVTCATLLLGLGAIEAVALTMMPHTQFTHNKDFRTDRPEIGWGPTRPGRYPNQRIDNGKTIYNVVYTIDPDLLRHVDSNPKGPTIAFFGDSFTFGDGVNDDGTLPQHFANLVPGLHVLNLAFSAYSPAQMLRELEVGLYDKQLADARLFLIETGPLHAERIACKPNFSLRAPRYVTVDGKLGGQLAYEGPCTSGLWRRVRELVAESAIERVFVSPVTRRTTHDDIVTYLNVMSAIAKLAREKYHVPLVVIYIPSDPPPLDGTGFTDATIESALRSYGIHVVTNEIDENQPVRIPGDGHFTSLGNKLIAQKVFDDLEAKMPDVLKPKS